MNQGSVAGWTTESEITRLVEDLKSQCLGAYAAYPDLVEEHFAIERNIAEGGYGNRQLYELVQNGSDAALDGGLSGAPLSIVLTNDNLYCANQGEPITTEGLTAILGAHRSAKRGNQIGRFGVGFKSVLAVTDSPEFFSRSGSFGFDPSAARELVRNIVETDRVASLRLAFAIDPLEAAESDPILGDLMSWATTVVRLPLNRPGAARLSDDIAEFPSQFMLFSRHVGQLILQDRTTATRRKIRAVADGDDFQISEDDRTSNWRLIDSVMRISDQARAEAGELAERETLPLVWAVPLDSAAERGAFWAFFPTEFWTSTRGILNAPWKTNSDRQNLLKGDFNGEMIRKFAGLITDSLRTLRTDEDPARHLDYLPGGREAPQWADALLTEEVYDLCSITKCIPDLDGELQLPRKMRIPPEKVPPQALTIFCEESSDRSWTHPSTEGRNRRPRVVRLLDKERCLTPTTSQWISSLAAPGDARSSAAAIRIAAVLAVAQIPGGETAPLALTSTGSLTIIDPRALYLPTPEVRNAAPGVQFVAAEVLEFPGTREALETLSIRELDARGQLDALLNSADLTSPRTWPAVWSIADQLDTEMLTSLLVAHDVGKHVRVQTEDGGWHPLANTLLPGEIVSAGDPEVSHVVIDLARHGRHLNALTALGAVAGPTTTASPTTEPWWADYSAEQKREFLARPEVGGRSPRTNLLVFTETGFAGPCSPLQSLPPEQNARYTRALLAEVATHVDWQLRHKSAAYGVMDCVNPALWFIRQFGLLPTSLGAMPMAKCLAPSIKGLGDVLPVADVSTAVADQLGLETDLASLSIGTWRAALALGFDAGPERLGRVVEACLDVAEDIPRSFVAGGKKHELSSFVACVAGDSEAAAEELGQPYCILSTPDAAAMAVEQLGMMSSLGFFSTEIVAVGESGGTNAALLFPDLVLLDSSLEHLEVVTCESILIERASENGSVVKNATVQLTDNTLYVVGAADDKRAMLDAIAAEKGWHFRDSEIEELLKSEQKASVRATTAEVRALATVEEKILHTIGAERLVRRLPRQLLDDSLGPERGGDPTARNAAVARLALAVHGVEVLKHHAADLAAAGFTVPSQWAGGGVAQAFVAELGFPPEFAGFPSAARAPFVDVLGPPELPELHDFQRSSADRIKDLVAKGKGRGMLSLPTGAGKTRTAVQALIESIVDGDVDGPILWVAQTDELCEQAVAAWSDTWRAIGSRDTLRISRLWATRSAKSLDDDQHVVIATIAKLDRVLEDDSYSWLSGAAVLVIDEAHRATTTTYTQLLQFMGMGRNVDRIPLIGLSATPFRGTSETETEALAVRFGRERLDDLGDQPYELLQDKGVLARVEHHLLEGASIKLTSSELEELHRLKRMPSSVLERIGGDSDRNETIVSSIEALADDATVLLFAASVAHAELLAGLLELRGIASRAVSAKTNQSARHHYVEQFRRGDIRVLTNYGVLTEGFDAPAVQAVYVARPTYSPNVYQQMIGRGLRGPKNGGKDTCLIVNVADNLAEYGEDLAFRQFEYLWSNDV